MFAPLFLILLLVSLVIGSFVGVLAQRYDSETLLGRSHCDACGHSLQVLDLIPLLSWMALRGRCRYCGARLSLSYPLYEIAATVPVIWAGTVLVDWSIFISTVFGWFLLSLALIDARMQRLPDILTLPMLCIGIVAAFLFDHDAILDHVLGAVTGFLSLAVVAVVYQRSRGRVGLGWGDAKFMAALGAWVTWFGLPILILLASLTALIWTVGSVLIKGEPVNRISRHHRIAFGPFLAFSGWIVWLYGGRLFRLFY